ncbi:c-type cytochrome [Paenochrobactrum pullorum]|uniref:c-type cytochrome n=1 Tax=Paenochrobactrum pullorum TaxID=1324351 RepID=UPI0035BBDF93
MKMKLTLLAALISFIVPALADGDPVAGKNVFKKCQACHTIDGANRVGPTLAGIVGRPVATAEGFKYSPAMTEFANDGKSWDEDLLIQFLSAPKATVKGTSMAFAGVKKPQDLSNLIAYLTDPAKAN